MQASRPSQETIATVIGWLKRGFDATATWVTQLSWWKFFLFAAVALLAASILEDKLFSGPPPIAQPSARAPMQRPSGEGAIIIDDSGIRYSPGKRKNDASSTPPADSGEIHIGLPPQISEGISDAIEAAVAAKVEEKSKDYHEQASTWFKSFVFLLVLAMFATKALVGGKQRAEAQTQSANAAAERASMQRQLSETRMQMMQAQVEPHFLFNTLASVEYLIETDPPRASAMQHSLIQYLSLIHI